MHTTAEIRWFWKSLPEGLDEWFHDTQRHGIAAGGGEPRVDRYLVDCQQTELGVKCRDNRPSVEIKGLVAADWASVDTKPFEGPLELWCKWSSLTLPLEPESTIPVEKHRWLREFDLGTGVPRELQLDRDERPQDVSSAPSEGCRVELTKLQVPNGEIWWTFALEAFGHIEKLPNHVNATADLLNTRQPPPLGHGFVAAYPLWLSGLPQERPAGD